MSVFTDAALAALAIPARNAVLDAYQAERDEWESAAEIAAEAANERFWEEGPHGGYYAGSQEEALDRYLDSLRGL